MGAAQRDVLMLHRLTMHEYAPDFVNTLINILKLLVPGERSTRASSQPTYGW